MLGNTVTIDGLKIIMQQSETEGEQLININRHIEILVIWGVDSSAGYNMSRVKEIEACICTNTKRENTWR